MSRLRHLHHDELDAPGLAVWDLIVSTRGSHVITPDDTLSGPFNAFLHAPEAGGHAAALGAALRYHTSLGQRLTEVVIITVASRWKAEFEWWAHSRVARENGVPDAVVDAISRGEEPPFTADDERIVYTAAHEISHTGQLSQASYDAASKLLGETGVVELVALCGYYSLISFMLNSFGIPLPDGVQPVWAEPVSS